MLYNESLKSLERFLVKANIIFSLEEIASSDINEIYREIFCNKLFVNIKEFGYLSSKDIKFISEDISLYSLSDLYQKQEGYRFDANTKIISSDWDLNKFVIADWMANPISIDRDCSIWVSIHGTGEWKYAKIFEKIEDFYVFLGKWLKFYVLENDMNITDANFEVTDENKKIISDIVMADMPVELKSNLINFIFQ